MLDFTPNAVHSGIYAAQAEGFYGDAGVDLKIHQPGESTDAPKLLAAGRTDFAILDIHDLGIARERGLDLVGVMPIVQRPLAAVIARGDARDRAARATSKGTTVGVTGLPSDEAVVDSEVSADGGDPAKVDEVTIGFNAVSSLAAGKVDAATGFWNAEGVALRRQGVPIRDLQGRPLRRSALPRAGPDHLAARPSTATPSWSTRSSPRPAAATPSPSSTRRRPSTTSSPPTRRSNAPTSRRSCKSCSPTSTRSVRPAVLANGRPGTSNTACSKSRSTSTGLPPGLSRTCPSRPQLSLRLDERRLSPPAAARRAPAVPAPSASAGPTRSTPAASAASWVSTSTWE